MSSISITPSEILQYQYCPRFIYFENVLGIPQYEEKSYKVLRGRLLHERKTVENKDYLRKKIGAVAKLLDQYLANELLRGKVDEVLTLADGSMAPLDYKFAEYKETVFRTHKTQLACYALLIEANFNKPVNRGYLVYTRSRNKLIEVEITPATKQQVLKSAREIVHIIENNHFPKATRNKKKCLDCTYRNICIQ